MNERGLRQVDILRMCEPICKQHNVRLGRNDISQYLSGYAAPKQDKLTVLALALNVSEAWLMGYDVPMQRNFTQVETVSIPLLGQIACGEPITAEETFECYVEAGSKIHIDFCLRAKGDSMINARIFDGDIVFIRKQPTVENGEIAAVLIGDEATLKRVFVYPEEQKLVLQAENPSFAPLVYVGEELENVSILGKAVAFQSDVR
jgi:repressor LexA